MIRAEQTKIKVVKAPDALLRAKTKPVKKVSPELIKTIEEMVKITKSFKDPEGVGLASTQIGQDGRFFVVKNSDETFTAVFNPEILSYSKKTKVFLEGCLSIPDYYGEVTRPVSVKVSFMDKNYQKNIKTLYGTAAWIFQHEYDHLQGKLFIDYVLEQKARLFRVIGRDRAGAEIFEEMRL